MSIIKENPRSQVQEDTPINALFRACGTSVPMVTAQAGPDDQHHYPLVRIWILVLVAKMVQVPAAVGASVKIAKTVRQGDINTAKATDVMDLTRNANRATPTRTTTGTSLQPSERHAMSCGGKSLFEYAKRQRVVTAALNVATIWTHSICRDSSRSSTSSRSTFCFGRVRPSVTQSLLLS